MPILDPDQPHEIPLADACAMTSRYRNSGQFNNYFGGFFGSTAIREILDQDSCVGIRYYYGLNDQENPVLILVGVDAENKDLVEGKIAEMSLPCPELCDSTSPLKND
jgi:hypothetical protein